MTITVLIFLLLYKFINSNSGKKEKKKGPSFNISGVTVTAQVVLKATHDLDTLDDIIPKSREEKKR